MKRRCLLPNCSASIPPGGGHKQHVISAHLPKGFYESKPSQVVAAMDILVRSLLNKGGMQDLMTVYMQDEFLPWRLTIDAEDGLFFQQLAEHIGERLPEQLTLYPVNAVVLTTHWAVVLHLLYELYLAGCATRDRFRSFIMNPAPGTSVSVSPVCSQKTSTTDFAQARRQDVSAESYVLISDDELPSFDFAHAQTQESYILISDDEQAQSSEYDVATYGDGHQLSAVQVRLLRLAHGSRISASSQTRTTFEGEALNDFELFEQFVGGNCNTTGGQCQGPDQFLQHPEMLLDNAVSKSKRRRLKKRRKKLQPQPQTDDVGKKQNVHANLNHPSVLSDQML